jgi:hypothetical protein
MLGHYRVFIKRELDCIRLARFISDETIRHDAELTHRVNFRKLWKSYKAYVKQIHHD